VRTQKVRKGAGASSGLFSSAVAKTLDARELELAGGKAVEIRTVRELRKRIKRSRSKVTV